MIATGRSRRSGATIARGIEERIHHDGQHALSVEGLPHAHWVVLDYDDVVIHVFYQPAREFYRLESVWSDGHEVALPSHSARKLATCGCTRTAETLTRSPACFARQLTTSPSLRLRKLSRGRGRGRPSRAPFLASRLIPYFFAFTIPISVTVALAGVLGGVTSISMLPGVVPVCVGVKVIVNVLVLPGAIPLPPPPPPPVSPKIQLGIGPGEVPFRRPFPTFFRTRFAFPSIPMPLLVMVNVFGTESWPGNPVPVR